MAQHGILKMLDITLQITRLKEQMLQFTLQWQPSDDVRATLRLYTFRL
jgi:hypothetical protein